MEVAERGANLKLRPTTCKSQCYKFNYRVSTSWNVGVRIGNSCHVYRQGEDLVSQRSGLYFTIFSYDCTFWCMWFSQRVSRTDCNIHERTVSRNCALMSKLHSSGWRIVCENGVVWIGLDKCSTSFLTIVPPSGKHGPRHCSNHKMYTRSLSLFLGAIHR